MNRLLPLLVLCVGCNTPAPPPPANMPEAGGELRLHVLRLENAPANDVAKELEKTLASSHPGSGGGFKVAVQPDQNALVLSGTPEQIKEALDVVARLDSASGR